MHCEIVMIGTELLLARSWNESGFLGQVLAENGIPLYLKRRSATMPTDQACWMVAESFARVLTSGGLGPTEDDITRGVSPNCW
jgi:molybdopterin-biosynthesis enzyme MoeA-like protein